MREDGTPRRHVLTNGQPSGARPDLKFRCSRRWEARSMSHTHARPSRHPPADAHPLPPTNLQPPPLTTHHHPHTRGQGVMSRPPLSLDCFVIGHVAPLDPPCIINSPALRSDTGAGHGAKAGAGKRGGRCVLRCVMSELRRQVKLLGLLQRYLSSCCRAPVSVSVESRRRGIGLCYGGGGPSRVLQLRRHPWTH